MSLLDELNKNNMFSGKSDYFTGDPGNEGKGPEEFYVILHKPFASDKENEPYDFQLFHEVEHPTGHNALMGSFTGEGKFYLRDELIQNEPVLVDYELDGIAYTLFAEANQVHPGAITFRRNFDRNNRIFLAFTPEGKKSMGLKDLPYSSIEVIDHSLQGMTVTGCSSLRDSELPPEVVRKIILESLSGNGIQTSAAVEQGHTLNKP